MPQKVVLHMPKYTAETVDLLTSGCPKHLPSKDYRSHGALSPRRLRCSRNSFVSLARSVSCRSSVSGLFGQLLQPHDSHFLWRALWAARSYRDRCVPSFIKFNQFHSAQLVWNHLEDDHNKQTANSILKSNSVLWLFPPIFYFWSEPKNET